MMRRKHIHDWQWSEQQERYLCHCGESLLSEATPQVKPSEAVTLYKLQIRVDSADKRAYFSVNGSAEQPLVEHLCYSCLGSGYSDYAIGQPCEICHGWGYWEEIV